MKGANEYASLFETGQYGRLYITSGSHARGATFHIQVLPKDEVATPNGEHNLCTNKNAVEVYGIIAGNPGWTEEYGWLHKGRWQEDFAALVEQRKRDIEQERQYDLKNKQDAKAKSNERIKKLLASY